ncbi:formylglycine-generating enzyme family protein [Candidatus Magnetomonas plexicatena]|uniref:formylglycine-generating enzyme family protein n=1 Tax=Candidatus Magnetomonas plexicatena TaxID=2552947 RepID=UPI001C757B7A|nr:formylglycine-generating enzyme family protein [Nitrospirales bacterium LBB_01]
MRKIVTILVCTAIVLTAVLVLKNNAYGETFTDSVTSMEFVKIGDGLYMGKYEVTNAQYRKFKPDHNSRAVDGMSLNGDNQPVVYVSFEEAEDFAKWLSHKTGMSFRLPASKEWESACRAGTDNDKYWQKPEDACRYANLLDITHRDKLIKENLRGDSTNIKCEDGFVVTAPVGSKEPNKFGLYDMLGNVSEWTATTSGDMRIVRGGSWHSNSDLADCYRFNTSFPNTWDGDLGFRLVYEKKQ